jgi:hypothetical protein
MRRGLLIALAVVVSTAAASSQTKVQENQPGMPTVARTYVLNQGSAEAVPVAIQNSGEPLPIVAAGVVNVATSGSATVSTRQARQAWEYRQVPLAGGVDQLNAAGGEGWEAVGVVTGVAGGPAILLKRPR